jgi:preprotein translocase subunit SecE
MPVKETDKQVKAPAARGSLARIPGRGIGERIREIRSELRKVVWPTRDEAIRLTLVVIGVSAAVGLSLGLVDSIFSWMFQLILR